MLEDVKSALSIDYSDEKMDKMLQLKIDAGVEYLKEAGIVITEDSSNSALYKNAIITFVLDNWQLDSKITFSPAFISYVKQLQLTEEEE